MAEMVFSTSEDYSQCVPFHRPGQKYSEEMISFLLQGWEGPQRLLAGRIHAKMLCTDCVEEKACC
jgi:hypothetical protein